MLTVEGAVRRAGFFAVLTTVVALGLSACTESPEAAPAPTGGTAPTSPTTSTSSGGTTTSTTTSSPTETTTTDEGLLGTLIRVVFPSIPAGRCSERVAVGTDFTVLTIERLETVRVCFDGLRSNPSPSLVVTNPNGQDVPVPLESGTWNLDADLVEGPTTELGSYTFRLEEPTARVPAPTVTPSPNASTGDTLAPSSTPTPTNPTQKPTPSAGDTLAPVTRVTSGRFEIVSASLARIRLAPNVAAGGTLGVQLAGYAASTGVRMAVYRARTATQFEPSYDLVKELQTRRTDAAGELATTWSVPTSAEPALYVLWTDPGPARSQCQDVGCTGFIVIGP